MTITPVQFFVTSAVTQKAPLSGSSVSAASSLAGVNDVVGLTNKITPAIVPDISSQLVAASGLYNAYVSLASTNSGLNIAQSGAKQISLILQQMQDIAAQIAGSSGDSASLTALEAEFQGLYSQIDNIANNASFNGSSLLDGSFSLDTGSLSTNGAGQTTTTIPNLTTKSLFGNVPPRVNTVFDAGTALGAIADAQDVVNGASDTIDNISSQVNFAMASVETVEANSVASSSNLSAADLISSGFAALLLGKPTSSATVQTGKMSDKLLSLISAS
ncbi:MAG TPA: hypothetical protein VFT64_10240 [Rickettsiales bacterium]|nr:hypothetical protein [Rickettsiales bacterium]